MLRRSGLGKPLDRVGKSEWGSGMNFSRVAIQTMFFTSDEQTPNHLSHCKRCLTSYFSLTS